MGRLKLTRSIAAIPLGTVLLIVVLAVLSVDLVMLELKRQVFRGGFLQAHRIVGWKTPLFLAGALAVNLFFYGALLAGSAALACRFRWRRAFLVYHFLWCAGVLSILVIGVRHELGNYFSDFLGFTVLRNLGGGRIGEALHYALEDGMPLAGFVGLLAVVYLAGHVLLSRRMVAKESCSEWGHSARRHVWMGLGATLALALVLAVVNREEDIRYNMGYTVAYAAANGLFDRLTDTDGDGVGLYASPPDLSPFNAAVYPGALDVPDDGIDQDGLFGDFHYVARPAPRYHFAGPRRNVVVIVLESARADALDMEVEGIPVMPNTRQLAREGWSSGEYYSHTGFTSSSIKAIFSGSLAQRAPAHDNLFSLLRQQGYQVGIFSAQSESFGGMAEDLRMRELADVYYDAQSDPQQRVFPSRSLSGLKQSGDWVVNRFWSSRSALDWKQPFALYFNIQSAHFPYFHPGMPQILPGKPIPRGAISASRRDWLRHTYYNALAYADRCVGEVVSLLKQLGVYENTVVMVAGDHGEALFDNDFLGHGHFLEDAQTRAVFAMNRKPAEDAGAVPGKSAGAFGQTALLPVLMQAAGAEVEGIDSLEPGRPVFQFIGNLDRPAAIGFVETGGRRLSLQLASGDADFFDGKGWVPRRIWENQPDRKARLKSLVEEWEGLRWEDRRGATQKAHEAMAATR